MLKITAVSVGHRGNQVLAVVASMKTHFGNPGKLFAQFILILTVAEPVMINALIKIGVFRTEGDALPRLSGLRITRVKEAFVVGVPGGASSRGGTLHSLDFIRQLPAGLRFVEEEGALFAPILREGDGYQRAIMRRHKPIDRGGSGRIDSVWVDDSALGLEVVNGVEPDERGLLPERFELECENIGSPGDQR